jgi:hypothetical protein
MTLDEWEAIAQQLQGPLNMLLHRTSWIRDTT